MAPLCVHFTRRRFNIFDAIGEAAAAVEHMETTLQMLDGQRVWQSPQRP